VCLIGSMKCHISSLVLLRSLCLARGFISVVRDGGVFPRMRNIGCSGGEKRTSKTLPVTWMVGGEGWPKQRKEKGKGINNKMTFPSGSSPHFL